MSNKKFYTEDSIQSLNPREFTRLRPGVYVGDTTYSTQLLIEVISNAVDEFKAGHGDTINIDYWPDGTCSVEDFGQGFPVNSMREDGETVLQAAFDVLNTSGKFSDDGVYEGTALGLNGIGSKIVVFLSKETTVTTCRNNELEMIFFENGLFKDRIVNTKNCVEHTGTTVYWTPDPKFFTHPEIEEERVKKLLHTLVCLCKGLTINLTRHPLAGHPGSDVITTTYYSKYGLNDLVDEIVDKKEIIHDRLCIEQVNGKNKIDFVLTYSNAYSSTIVPYVNTGETDSGPHITQVKTIITREFNKFFREKGWLKDKDSNLDGSDIQEGLVIVFNMTTPGVAYDAQTKSRIVKMDMTPFTSVITDNLQRWLALNETDVKKLFDKAANARKAREAAKKAREAARENQKKKKEKVLKFDSKLADCFGKDRNKCELYVVEGE